MNVLDTQLPFQPGGFDTLSQALDYAAKGAAGMHFFDVHGNIENHCTFATLRTRALKTAAVLSQYAFPRASRIAILAQTSIDFPILFFACQYLGLVPCPLPFTILPASKEIYESQLTHLLKTSQAKLLLTPKNIETIAQAAATKNKIPTATFETLASQIPDDSIAAPASEHMTPLQPGEEAFVQFSSGSTSAPTGIVITQKAVIANLGHIARDGMKVNAHDRAFSWLPFHHDMGLVGFILSPVNTQTPVDYLPAAAFSRSPALWLKLMSQRRSSIAFAPGFAYALAAQHTPSPQKLDLSALRIAGIGGDMVHAQTLKDFAKKMAPSQFRFDAFCPCYGLAQATLAVTMTSPDEPPYIQQFSQSGHTKELVSCGKPLPGYAVKIHHAQQSISTAHDIGEIWVKGPSVVIDDTDKTSGLKNYLRTGDLGFMHNGHLFITGRVKDLIIIRGRNIWAQDVEWALAECYGELNEQNIAAIGIEKNQEEHLVVIIENIFSDQTPQQTQTRQQRLLSVINQTFGVTAELIWVQPQTLAVTSSGKLARAQIKTQYLNNTLPLYKG